MTLKIITSAIIVASSTLIGWEIARSYIVRTNELRELQSALSRLETEILHFATRLPEAMAIISTSAKGQTKELFKSTKLLLSERKNLSVSQAWALSLDELKGILQINEDEFGILYRLGDQLGTGDKEGQGKYIRLALSQLQQQELKAQETRSKYERMYKSLGLLGGITLAIILL